MNRIKLLNGSSEKQAGPAKNLDRWMKKEEQIKNQAGRLVKDVKGENKDISAIQLGNQNANPTWQNIDYTERGSSWTRELEVGYYCYELVS